MVGHIDLGRAVRSVGTARPNVRDALGRRKRFSGATRPGAPTARAVDMSRSGFSDCDGDDENPACYLWESVVARAIGGRRGQSMLRELALALDAMTDQRLVVTSFQAADDELCTLGALGVARGVDMTGLPRMARADSEGRGHADIPRAAAETFGVARAMAHEIMYENDEGGPASETPEQHTTRWTTCDSNSPP